MNAIFRQNYIANVKKLFKLSLPILISQLAVSGMGLIDVVMAGLVSDEDVSAVAVSNSIYLPLFLFVLGILNAITPTVSYLNGSNQRHLIAHQIRQGSWIVLGVSILLLLVYANSDIILQFMQTPESFAGKTQDYLIAVSFGVIPALLAVNLRCLNDGLSNPKPMMYITFLGLLLNIPLNYLFIFGKLGFPALGAVGCGVATAIVNWIMFALLVSYCYTNTAQKDLKLFEKWVEKPCKATLMKLLKLGMPIGFAVFTEVMLFTASSLIISPFGSQVVASHQVALQTSSLFFMIPLSLSIATTIMVGDRLGKYDINGAKQLSYHAIISCILVAILAALVIFLFKDWIPYFFTNDAHSVAIAGYLLIFAGIYQIPDAIQGVANGILRGYKYTRPILITTLICYWLIGMPVGIILARTDWITSAPMEAAGFWITFCLCLSLVAILLCYFIYKIQSLSEREQIERLEAIK